MLGVIFVIAGALHFILTTVYMKIMPPYLPQPRLLVQISGALEMIGGLGLLQPATQRYGAWLLIAVLIGVMPANVQMALHPERWRSIPQWMLWARLPLQLPLIWWTWLYTRL